MNIPSSRPAPMQQYYQPFFRQAEALQNSFHARLADPFNPMAMMMKHEADELVGDIQANKHPVEVEDRIRSIQGHLIRLQDITGDDPAVITAEANDYLHRGYGRLRKALQELPQYQVPRAINTYDRYDPRSGQVRKENQHDTRYNRP